MSISAAPSTTTPGTNPAFLRPTAAIVPAAGFGSRLRPLTDALPKEMLPVGRRLALERIVDELRAAGMTRIVFVLSPVKEPLIRRVFGEGADGVTFAYALQPEMRGLGDAILHAEPFLDPAEPFVVALGDAVFEEPLTGGVTSRLTQAFAADPDNALGLVVQRVPRERISRYGVVQPIGNAGTEPFALSDIVEKPAPEDAPSDYAAAARYVLTPEIFAVLRTTPPSKNGEIQLTDAMRTVLAQGRKGVAVPLQTGEIRHDIGSLDSYFKAFIAFALADPEQGESLRRSLEQQFGGPSAERNHGV